MTTSLERVGLAGRDVIRALGGLLLASGAVVLFIRKSSQDEWGDFGRLLVLLIPCAVLYVLALGIVGPGRTPSASGAVSAEVQPEPWRPAFLVFAILLVPLTLFQFLQLVDGSTDDSLNQAWIFALTAVLAAYGSLRARISYALLLAALATIFAWLAFWDKVLDEPSGTTNRWLLVLIGIGLLLAAARLRARGDREADELVTGGGVALVLAASLGAVAIAIGLVQGLGGAFGLGEVGGVKQHMEWDFLLLLVSLALILYGSRSSIRGPAYIGAFGLLAFIASVGVEIARVADQKQPEGELIGWPILLLIAGVAGIAFGFGRNGGGGRTTTVQPAVPAATPPPAPPPPAPGPGGAGEPPPR
jgi:hypothetical protein